MYSQIQNFNSNLALIQKLSTNIFSNFLHETLQLCNFKTLYTKFQNFLQLNLKIYTTRYKTLYMDIQNLLKIDIEHFR